MTLSSAAILALPDHPPCTGEPLEYLYTLNFTSIQMHRNNAEIGSLPRRRTHGPAPPNPIGTCRAAAGRTANPGATRGAPLRTNAGLRLLADRCSRRAADWRAAMVSMMSGRARMQVATDVRDGLRVACRCCDLPERQLRGVREPGRGHGALVGARHVFRARTDCMPEGLSSCVGRCMAAPGHTHLHPCRRHGIGYRQPTTYAPVRRRPFAFHAHNRHVTPT